MLGLFKNQKVVKSSVVSSDCIKKHEKQLIKYIGKYDNLYSSLVKSYKFKTDNQKIATFAFVFYLLELGLDKFYFENSVDQKKDYILTDDLYNEFDELAFDAIYIYKSNKLKSITLNYNENIEEEFDEKTRHLFDMDILYLISSEKSELLIEYLLVFIFTNDYKQIDPTELHEENAIRNQLEKLEMKRFGEWDEMQFNKTFILKSIIPILLDFKQSKYFSAYYFLKSLKVE